MPTPTSKIRAPGLSWAICNPCPLSTPAFDVALSGLVLNFVPDQPRALLSWRRVVRPGGIVAVYLWDYAGEMQFMRHFWDVATALDPAAPDEGSRFPICQPEPLQALFAVPVCGRSRYAPSMSPPSFATLTTSGPRFSAGRGPPAYVMVDD